MMRSWYWPVIIAAVLGAQAAEADDDVPTTIYVVRDGDTCASIAARELGDRKAYTAIHELNPDLGPLPHRLGAGSRLHLPARRGEPDARLAGASGTVRVRDPGHDDWQTGRRGMDLFRAWRVNTAERSSAELRFRDQSEMSLRENTIVIVYGSTRGRAGVTRGEAALERGALRSRLSDLGGVEVRLPGGVAALGEGSAVVEVEPSGRTALSVHGGRPVALRGRRGGAVAVAPGMGTGLVPGKPPERPRRLPATPRFTAGAARVLLAPGGVAAPEVAWVPVDGADAYRVELVRGGTVIATSVVAANGARSIRFADIPAGGYQVRVAARTSDGLESAPASLELIVLAVAIVPPGAPPPSFPLPGGAATATAVASRGARVVAYGARCLGTDRAVLERLGTTHVHCVLPDGVALAPLAIEVVDVAASVRAAAGGGGRYELAMSAGAPVGDALALVARSGATLDQIERTPAGWSFSVRRHAPGPVALAVHDRATGYRIAVATLP